MHIKFINRGSGSCQKACNYIARQPKDGEQITTLRGNPNHVAAVADSLEFKEKYRSAVIAWHPDDKPTPEQIEAVLNDFEAVAFAGLEKDQYTFIAVQHTEKDGTPHLHIIAPRVDLESGRSMNIAPPGWQKSFDTVRDLHNFNNGWKSPDISLNPENARTTQLGLNRGSRKDLAERIDAHVVDGIEANEIKDRPSLVDSLEKAGLKVTKQGKEFITIIDPSDDKMKKGMRLKGAFYEKDFERVAVLKRGLGAEKRSEANRANQSFDGLTKDFNEAVRIRAGYNAERHPSPQPKAAETAGAEAVKLGDIDNSLLGVVYFDMPAGLAPDAKQNYNPERVQDSPKQQRKPADMQPAKLEHGQRPQHYSAAEIATENVLRLLENLARLFGLNVDLGSVKDDGNRAEFDSTIKGAKRASARAGAVLREHESRVLAASWADEIGSESIEPIQRRDAQTSAEAERAISALGEAIQHEINHEPNDISSDSDMGWSS